MVIFRRQVKQVDIADVAESEEAAHWKNCLPSEQHYWP